MNRNDMSKNCRPLGSDHQKTINIELTVYNLGKNDLVPPA